MTAHARRRMAERGISAEQVREVLASPVRAIPDPAEQSVRLERDYVDRTIKVWVVEPCSGTGEIVVKSTAWQPAATVVIPVGLIGHLIGRGGTRIGSICETTGARVDVNDDGIVRISGRNQSAVAAACRHVHAVIDQAGATPPARGTGLQGGKRVDGA